MWYNITMKTYKEMCEKLPIQIGDMIRIPKGTRIRTLHPKGPYNCAKTHKVIVHNVSPGYDESTYPARKAEVCWAGSGSYWCYADMDCVEKV
jgi:hypothetical protein